VEEYMTLNLTLATPRYIIQTSDRRTTSVPDGRIINDEANKGLVVKADDGIFSITFAGIGAYWWHRSESEQKRRSVFEQLRVVV
jgi:hypothetical protein